MPQTATTKNQLLTARGRIQGLQNRGAYCCWTITQYISSFIFSFPYHLSTWCRLCARFWVRSTVQICSIRTSGTGSQQSPQDDPLGRTIQLILGQIFSRQKDDNMLFQPRPLSTYWIQNFFSWVCLQTGNVAHILESSLKGPEKRR